MKHRNEDILDRAAGPRAPVKHAVIRGGLVLGALCCFSVAGSAETPGDAIAAEGRAFFESRVRPILVEHCYDCHSAGAEKLRGNLYLDSRDGWVKGGDSGMAIVPGDPDNSLVIQAVRYGDPDFAMPPKGRLSGQQVEALTRWVEMGAPDPRSQSTVAREEPASRRVGPDFWSFQPPAMHPVPKVRNSGWPRNEIDRFVLARLEQEGIEPAADADPRTLIRRVTFDLTGLPPTPEQLASVLGDPGPDAMARYVDRLLDSPHFGEHWGRHWLDLARYADSNGGDINLTFHSSWRYRDYVIDAFNRDLSFDRFIREQLAGDLMPSRTLEEQRRQMVATGFLVVGPKMLSERDKEKLYLDVADEQIDTVGKVFLGLTLGCARCHDHKFDPVSAEDYYALAGIFRSTVTVQGIRMNNVNVSGWIERELPVSGERRKAVEAHEAEVAGFEKSIASVKEDLEELRTGPKSYLRSMLGVVVDDAEAEREGYWKDSTYSPVYVGKGYIHDNREGKGAAKVTFRPDLPEPGEYEVRISFAASGGRDEAVPVRVKHAEGAELFQVDQTATPPIARLFYPLGRFRFSAGTNGTVTISNEGTTGYVLADAAQFVPVKLLQAKGEVAQGGEVGETQQEIARMSARLKDLEKELAEVRRGGPEPLPMAMAAKDREEVGDIRLCIRGMHKNRGEVIPRGFVQAASRGHRWEMPGDESGRLQLAEFIASRDNPLTARVWVNRVWHHLFGAGIVPSVDNFGGLGDRPSHPQLLDRLAVRFMDEGWSVKWLIREIVSSRTYRLSVDRGQGPGAQLDPENRWCWRQNRRRLNAESIRDAILAVSGSLDRRSGGTAVSELGEQAISNSRNQSGGVEADANRKRSIYLPLVRNDLPAFLTVFDLADPDVVTGRRAATTVPAQALLMMNSGFVRREARNAAERLLRVEGLSNAERIGRLHERMFGDLPTGDEQARMERFLEDRESSEIAEAWADLCQVLFASTEFRFIE